MQVGIGEIVVYLARNDGANIVEPGPEVLSGVRRGSIPGVLVLCVVKRKPNDALELVGKKLAV